MALLKRPASPTEGKTSTAKKVAAASVGKYEIGAIETKIAVAQPKVDKPSASSTIKTKAPAAEDVAETKEKTVAPRKKVEAKKPAETVAVKSVAAKVAEPAKKESAAKKETAKKEAPAKKAAAKKAPAKKTPAARKTTAAKTAVAAKAAPAKKTAAKKTAAKKTTAKRTTAAKAAVFQIEYQGNNITADAIEAKLADELKARGIKGKDAQIYVKPEENMVYTVVDGNQVDFPLF